MGYAVQGILQARILECIAFTSSVDLSNPEIEQRSPTLWADSLPAEPQGKPKNIGVGSPSFLQKIFPTQESNWGSCITGGFFTDWTITKAQKIGNLPLFFRWNFLCENYKYKDPIAVFKDRHKNLLNSVWFIKACKLESDSRRDKKKKKTFTPKVTKSVMWCFPHAFPVKIVTFITSDC